MLIGTDAWDDFQELVRGERGAGVSNPTGTNQHSEVNRDTITVNLTEPDHPSTIRLDPDVPRPKRDYGREASTGTSRSYAIRRLSRERPDLHVDDSSTWPPWPPGHAPPAGWN